MSHQSGLVKLFFCFFFFPADFAGEGWRFEGQASHVLSCPCPGPVAQAPCPGLGRGGAGRVLALAGPLQQLLSCRPSSSVGALPTSFVVTLSLSHALTLSPPRSPRLAAHPSLPTAQQHARSPPRPIIDNIPQRIRFFEAPGLPHPSPWALSSQYR